MAMASTTVAVMVGTPAELASAIAQAQPGEEVVMEDGEWNDVLIRFHANGEEGQPITLRAETPGDVRMTGASRLFIGGDHLVVRGLHFTDGFTADGDHVIMFRGTNGVEARFSRLTETAIVDYSPPWPDSDAGTQRYFWVIMFGSYNRVDHCYFQGHNNSGVTVSTDLRNLEPVYHRIDHNHFADRDPPPAGIDQKNGYETIRLGAGSRGYTNARVTVANNLLVRVNGEGEAFSNKSQENFFLGNVFVDSAGHLSIRQGNRNVIRGNSFFGMNEPEAGGIRITEANNLVVNNYFQDLSDTSLGAAIALQNGIDGDPIANVSYGQPVDTIVAHNSLVDCRWIHYGAFAGRFSGSQPLGPLAHKRTLFVNNEILGQDTNPIFDIEPGGEAEDPIYFGNLYDNDQGLGLPQGTGGFKEAALAGREEINGLSAPAADNPARNSVRHAAPHSLRSILGRHRDRLPDAGAFEVSSSEPNPGLTLSPQTGPRTWSYPIQNKASGWLISGERNAGRKGQSR